MKLERHQTFRDFGLRWQSGSGDTAFASDKPKLACKPRSLAPFSLGISVFVID